MTHKNRFYLNAANFGSPSELDPDEKTRYMMSLDFILKLDGDLGFYIFVTILGWFLLATTML